MLTAEELALLKDGEAWVEYDSNLYECIGMDERGRNILLNIENGYVFYVYDKSLLNSTEFYFTFRY